MNAEMTTKSGRTSHWVNRSSFRLFVAVPLGLMTAIGLFCFMSWMVGSVKTGMSDDQAPMAFDMVMQEQDSQSQRRLRKLPEPPEVPESPQELMQPQSLSTPVTSTALSQVEASQAVLDINVALSDFGVAVNMPTINTAIGNDIGQQQQAMPLYRAEPAYPARLLKRRVEGFVVMSFTISEEGKPEDIEVVQAEPTKAFVRSAVQALRNWKYQPKIEGGKAVKQGGQKVKIEFKISQ